MGSDTEKHWIIFVCTSMNASYAAAEKSEWRMASKIFSERSYLRNFTHTKSKRTNKRNFNPEVFALR